MQPFYLNHTAYINGISDQLHVQSRESSIELFTEMHQPQQKENLCCVSKVGGCLL